jgi:fructokinase
MDNNQNKFTDSPIIIGEVLFDRFPDGKKVLGGAPFNVAWNLRGFGAHPLFISAVGNDQPGQQVLQRMRDWNMDEEGISIVDSAPTGAVEVEIHGNQHDFSILPDQAYDFIPNNISVIAQHFGHEQNSGGQQRLGNRPAMIYHGTLACRSPVSRDTIVSIRQQCDAPVFIDINLREPWYEVDRVLELLSGADYLKLSIDELVTLTQCNATSTAAVVDAAHHLLSHYSIKSCWVTAGADGAYAIYSEQPFIFHKSKPVTDFVDSVGAGDAFTSVIILGLMHNWDCEELLMQAVRFSASVCSIKGAITSDHAFYQDIYKLVGRQPT